MMQGVRTSQVLFGYLVARLRRVPPIRGILDHSLLFAGAMVAAAVAAFAIWGATIAPERVTLGDLVVGKLSTMQTWIILTGDVAGGTSTAAGYRYVLTDPAAPNARLNVISEIQVPLGRTTISGSYVGGRDGVPIGFTWIGTLRADAELAPELGPPWGAIAFVALGALVVVSARAPYPVFVRRPPGPGNSAATHVNVGVRSEALGAEDPSVPATLDLQPGGPVELVVTETDRQPLRLHSVHTGVDVGELRRLGGSEPALRIWRSSDPLTLTFSSSGDRDAANAAMVADEQARTGTVVAA